MTASRRVVIGGLMLSPRLAARAQHQHDPDPAHVASDTFASEMHRYMILMTEAMGSAVMTGSPDRDFLAMMLPHHQGAIDMARLLLLHGQDPLTRQIAEEIMASQQAEIVSMEARLRILGRGAPSEDGSFPALSGTRRR
jgi:uncharacterized protein (DUF305 family)